MTRDGLSSFIGAEYSPAIQRLFCKFPSRLRMMWRDCSGRSSKTAFESLSMRVVATGVLPGMVDLLGSFRWYNKLCT